MAKSAPQISFSVTSINYGTIDVGGSCGIQEYDIFGHGTSTLYTEAINMSISFKEVTNASEARTEEWVRVSTPGQSWTTIGSVSTGQEAYTNSVIAGTRTAVGPGLSVHVYSDVLVPSGAATAGAVSFYLHHRYQYTGDDDD